MFAVDCARLKRRLGRRRGLSDGRTTTVFDLVTALALIHTAIVSPFEVCAGVVSPVGSASYVVSILVNIVFALDVAMQFFLPVVHSRTGEAIRDHRRVARHYLSTWFAFDVISTLPFDMSVVVLSSLVATPGCASGAGSGGRAVKLVGLIRICNLSRLLRARRLVARWESSLSISTSARTMTNAWLSWGLLIHWLACLWLLQAQLAATWRDDDAVAAIVGLRNAANSSACAACTCASDANSAECRSPCLTPCEAGAAAAVSGLSYEAVLSSQPWTCRAMSRGWLPSDFPNDHSSTWVFAVGKIFGGLGDLGVADSWETLLFSFTSLSVRASFCILQGYVVRVLANGSSDDHAHRQQIDSVNSMLHDLRVPHPTRRTVREYLRRSLPLARRRRYAGLIESTLSERLQRDVRSMIGADSFGGVWWLGGCESACLSQLSAALRRDAFALNELIPRADTSGSLRLNILVSGVVSYAGGTYTAGNSWGDVLISASDLRDGCSARARGFCEVCYLTRATLDGVLGAFPASARAVRIAALQQATRRVIISIAMYQRLSGARARPVGQPHVPFKPVAILKWMKKEGFMAGVAWREPSDLVHAPSSGSPIALTPEAKQDALVEKVERLERMMMLMMRRLGVKEGAVEALGTRGGGGSPLRGHLAA